MRIPIFWTDQHAAFACIPALRAALWWLAPLYAAGFCLAASPLWSGKHYWWAGGSLAVICIVSVPCVIRHVTVARAVRARNGYACTTCLYPYPEHADPDKPCLCPECGSQIAPAEARRAWLHAGVWP